jgi:hypothetical protein
MAVGVARHQAAGGPLEATNQAQEPVSGLATLVITASNAYPLTSTSRGSTINSGKRSHLENSSSTKVTGERSVPIFQITKYSQASALCELGFKSVMNLQVVIYRHLASYNNRVKPFL